MNKEAVGNNIRRRLRINGITQKELTKELHVTEATVSRWVTGERQPSVYALYRMARFLGATMEELMEGVDG